MGRPRALTAPDVAEIDAVPWLTATTQRRDRLPQTSWASLAHAPEAASRVPRVRSTAVAVRVANNNE